MKSSNRDKVEGTLHEAKGAVKQVAGKLCDNPKMKLEGAVEKMAGKAQAKLGQVKKVLGK
ncbi:MAG: CsbD family protein [Desulfuromonadaceae bacterium]